VECCAEKGSKRKQVIDKPSVPRIEKGVFVFQNIRSSQLCTLISFGKKSSLSSPQAVFSSFLKCPQR
jgi:hypothetical protein